MTLFEALALLFAAGCVFGWWRAVQNTRALEARFDRQQKTLYETRAELRALREELETLRARMEIAQKQNAGQLRFDAALRLIDLYRAEPRAQELLAAFHIGGCDHCAVDERATLAQAAEQTGADLTRVLAALNNLPPDGRAFELRAPNLKFEI